MSKIETMSVNAIRVLSADAIQKAKSGHPGLPLGCASAAYELWANHMNHNPADRTGPTGTALSYPAATAPCFCIPCSIYSVMEIYQKKIS